MSTPMTCHANKKRKSEHTDPHREHLPHLIPRLLMPINKGYLQKFCAQSLESICKEYGVPAEHPTVLAIRECFAREMPFTEALSVFFVLLNIDTTVKERMMLSETEAQQQKLANFFMNLRKNLVSTYMSTDDCTPCKFVTNCTDAWSVA